MRLHIFAQHALLFPNTEYLSNQWWHRLAKVIFWTWLAFLIVAAYKIFLLDPVTSCLQVKYASYPEPSALDCGSNAFDYAWGQLRNEPARNVLIGAAILAVIFYIVALLPSLVYRVLLYVVAGDNWKDRAVP